MCTNTQTAKCTVHAHVPACVCWSPVGNSVGWLEAAGCQGTQCPSGVLQSCAPLLLNKTQVRLTAWEQRRQAWIVSQNKTSHTNPLKSVLGHLIRFCADISFVLEEFWLELGRSGDTWRSRIVDHHHEMSVCLSVHRLEEGPTQHLPRGSAGDGNPSGWKLEGLSQLQQDRGRNDTVPKNQVERSNDLWNCKVSNKGPESSS